MEHGCQYFDDGCPNNICYACEAEKRQREKAAMATAHHQLSLPDGHPQKVFTEAEIRDTTNVYANKKLFGRLLLRNLRRLM